MLRRLLSLPTKTSKTEKEFKKAWSNIEKAASDHPDFITGDDTGELVKKIKYAAIDFAHTYHGMELLDLLKTHIEKGSTRAIKDLEGVFNGVLLRLDTYEDRARPRQERALIRSTAEKVVEILSHHIAAQPDDTNTYHNNVENEDSAARILQRLWAHNILQNSYTHMRIHINSTVLDALKNTESAAVMVNMDRYLSDDQGITLENVNAEQFIEAIATMDLKKGPDVEKSRTNIFREILESQHNERFLPAIISKTTPEQRDRVFRDYYRYNSKESIKQDTINAFATAGCQQAVKVKALRDETRHGLDALDKAFNVAGTLLTDRVARVGQQKAQAANNNIDQPNITNEDMADLAQATISQINAERDKPKPANVSNLTEAEKSEMAQMADAAVDQLHQYKERRERIENVPSAEETKRIANNMLAGLSDAIKFEIAIIFDKAKDDTSDLSEDEKAYFLETVKIIDRSRIFETPVEQDLQDLLRERLTRKRSAEKSEEIKERVSKSIQTHRFDTLDAG